jgi:ubiquitin carboxyl-terminal hydrolase 7
VRPSSTSSNAVISSKPFDRYEDAREYYSYLLHKRVVRFFPHPQKCDEKTYPRFELALDGRISYDRLSEKVGEKLGVEPTHIRFYTVNAASGNPRTAVKRNNNPNQNQTLQSILIPPQYGGLSMTQRNDALFFEVLEMSLAELDFRKSIRVTLLSDGIAKEVSPEFICWNWCFQIAAMLIQMLRSNMMSWCTKLETSVT